MERIDQINPQDEKGDRMNRIHQHYANEYLHELNDQIRVVSDLLMVSEKRFQFMKAIRLCPNFKFDDNGNLVRTRSLVDFKKKVLMLK